ncbi:MAG: hypothetical protein IKV54_01770 [Clostridia bacterium]|nr:hypothetical protein [Clostridia bacterium]
MRDRYGRKISFKEKLISFMYGRNGADALGNFALILYFVLSVVNGFVGSMVASIIISLVCYALLIYSFFRMFSRNVAKRRKENQAFCGIGRKVRDKFRLMKNKWKDRKTHVYVKCPGCKNVLRLPKKKGENTVKCPCCSERFVIKQ